MVVFVYFTLERQRFGEIVAVAIAIAAAVVVVDVAVAVSDADADDNDGAADIAFYLDNYHRIVRTKVRCDVVAELKRDSMFKTRSFQCERQQMYNCTTPPRPRCCTTHETHGSQHT